MQFFVNEDSSLAMKKEITLEDFEKYPIAFWEGHQFMVSQLQRKMAEQGRVLNLSLIHIFLWERQYRVIIALAEKGPCVIVGRCADYILRDKADCLTVFIHADMKFRAERIVREYGEREQSPEDRLRDKDKRRAAYHRFYTYMKWGYAQNYHLTLDSGVLGIDRCVETICALYRLSLIHILQCIYIFG